MWLKNFIIITLFLIMLPLQLFCQSHLNENREDFVTIYGGIGGIESIVVGVEFKLIENLRGGIKASGVMIGGDGGGFPLFGRGPGAKMTYLFNNTTDWINTVNAEVTYMMYVGHQNRPPYGVSGELTIGQRNMTKGIHWFYYYGVGFSYAPKIPTLFMPCLKVGLLYNID